MSFKNIKEINVKNDISWQNSNFITLDIDWVDDSVLSFVIDFVEKQDVKATWFVTHKTQLLDRLRENPKFELGIHPNLNFILDGSEKQSSMKEKLLELMKIVPEAVTQRSHSVAQTSNMLHILPELGITHDSNMFIPEQSQIVLKPWLLYNGLTRCPYFWEDDVDCLYESKRLFPELLKSDGLKIFDFHPIHIFLNTEDLTRYNNSRSDHGNINLLKKFIFDGYGTRSKFEEIVQLVKE